MAVITTRVTELLDEARTAFSSGDVRTAARKWAEVLALEPDHAQARKLLESARNLLKSQSASAAPPPAAPSAPLAAPVAPRTVPSPLVAPRPLVSAAPLPGPGAGHAPTPRPITIPAFPAVGARVDTGVPAPLSVPLPMPVAPAATPPAISPQFPPAAAGKVPVPSPAPAPMPTGSLLSSVPGQVHVKRSRSLELKVSTSAPPPPAPEPALDVDVDDSAIAESAAADAVEIEMTGMHAGGAAAAPVAPPAPSMPPPSSLPQPDPLQHALECAALVSRARAYQAQGDFSGAVQLVRMALDLNPASPDAAAYMKQNEDLVSRMYEARLGGPAATFQTDLSGADLDMLELPPRARDLVLYADGSHTLAEVVSASGLWRLEALRLMDMLHTLGVIRG